MSKSAHRDQPMGESGHARRARLTADRILEAAVEAFAEDGYRAATIDGIAARADVAPSSVYNHFGSKAGIAQSLADRALGVHQEYVSAAWSLDASPLERLIAAAGATLAFAKAHPALFEAISLSYLGPLGLFPADTAAAQAIADRRNDQLERIAGALEAAVASGEVRPLDAHAAARFLVGAWAGVLTMESGRGGSGDPAGTLAAGIRALIEGIASPGTLRGDGRLADRYEDALARHGLTKER